MKKFLLSLVLIATSIGAWADDEVTAKVSGTSLNIALTNSVEYCAFQMDITLPSGVSASKVAAATNRLSQEGSETEIGGTKFIVAYNTLDGNVLRVIAYNLNNSAITGTSGDDILNITLSEAPSASGDVKVSNILFVNKENLNEVSFADVTGVDGFKMGDVDHNGEVNVNDVTATVKKSLGKSVTPFYEAQADIDGNGEINVNDVTGIVKISLGK